MSNRTYLWLTLVLGIIENRAADTVGDLTPIPANLPTTVDAAYEATMVRPVSSSSSNSGMADNYLGDEEEANHCHQGNEWMEHDELLLKLGLKI
jgi:hypothetical protein